jgi:hypothetical protein
MTVPLPGISPRGGKFAWFDGTEWSPYVYPNVWATEKTTGPERLVIAPATDQIRVLTDLADALPEPFGLLYVLLIPRGGGFDEPGRYQLRTTLSRESLRIFLDMFCDFLEGDGRHHLWVMSLPEQQTLVYDNHNVLYAYGPLAEYSERLAKLGLTEAPSVHYPAPHAHNYRPEFDTAERAISEWGEWLRFPLAPGDDP